MGNKSLIKCQKHFIRSSLYTYTYALALCDYEIFILMIKPSCERYAKLGGPFFTTMRPRNSSSGQSLEMGKENELDDVHTFSNFHNSSVASQGQPIRQGRQLFPFRRMRP
jgi:hypothetical protein